MIKQIVRVIFSRNSIPKTLVSDNFVMKILVNGWKKIGCKLYKTLPYHPQSNGLAVQTVKTRPKACFQQKETIEVFLPKLLVSYRTIPHTGRLESPSALMRRQIRALLTMSYSTNEKMWYKKNKESNLEKTEFIMQKGHNTVLINGENENRVFAHADQIRPQGKYEEQNEEEISTIPSVNDLLQNEMSEDGIMHDQVGKNEIENSDKDQIMQEDDSDYSSVRDRSVSLRERNTGERQREQSNPENEIITRRSTRPTRGIKSLLFREMQWYWQISLLNLHKCKSEPI